MAPSLTVRRHFHPHMFAQFEGPIPHSADEDDDGNNIGAIYGVSRRQGLTAAALAGPRVVHLLRRLNLPVVGVYHSMRYAFELRWRIDRSRHYVLRVGHDGAVNLRKLYGRYYGYPECCTDRMGCWLSLPGYEGSLLDGTGFVPCDHCHASRSPEELIAGIQSRRVCASPFPIEAHPILDDFWRALAVEDGRLAVPLHAVT